MAVTVAEVMNLGPLQGSKVLAGALGLGNVVRAVTVMDTPDISRWIRGGELLCSNVYVIRDDVEAQVRLVDELADHGAAGLVIKQKRFVEQLPAEMLRRADERRFPISEVPLDCAWVEVINPVLSLIISRHTVLLEESQRIHRRFTDIALHGDGCPSIACSLSELLDRHVVILDSDLRVLAYSNSPHPCGHLPSFCDCPGALDTLVRRLAEDPAISQNQRMCKTLSSRASAVRLGDMTRTMVKADFDYGLPEGPGELRPRRICISLAIDQPNGHSACLVSAIVAPVAVARRVSGWIVLIEDLESGSVLPSTEGGCPLETAVLIALEHASTVTALEMAKCMAVEEAERRFEYEFLSALLHGHLESHQVALTRARHLGWDLSRPHNLMILELDASRKSPEPFAGCDLCDPVPLCDYFLRRLRLAVEQVLPGAIVAEIGSSAVVLFPASVTDPAHRRDRDGPDDNHQDVQTASRLLQTLSLPESISIGIGRSYPGVMELYRSYREARLALDLGRTIGGRGAITRFDDLGVYRLIGAVTDRSALKDYCTDVLGPLLNLGPERSAPLLSTVECFIRTDGNARTMADKLFVHPNTIRYRLRQVERLLGLSLANARDKLSLQMALHVHYWLQSSQSGKP